MVCSENARVGSFFPDSHLGCFNWETVWGRLLVSVWSLVLYLNGTFLLCPKLFSLSMQVKVTQSCQTLWNPMDYRVHGNIQVRLLEWWGSSQPSDVSQVSRFPGGFFIIWATGKPKNTEVGRLSLLQQIFQTQESNWGLLHCRQILYQLSYEGSHLYLYRCVKNK